MALIYTSNTPEYLNYVASVKTRDQIMNDPDLCKLLEDPDIKDEMEAALKYREALYGDYNAKCDYIEFFLANAPEMDTDTIMHHRENILLDQTLRYIYAHEFSDLNTIFKAREEKFNKPVVQYNVHSDEYSESDEEDKDSLLDCLQNPCDYLGPFSSSMGLVGDKKNFATLKNVFSRILGGDEEEKEKEAEKKEKEADAKEAAANGKTTTTNGKTTTTKQTEEREWNIWGNIREHIAPKIVPDILLGYRKMMNMMGKQFNEFGQEYIKVNKDKPTTALAAIGDKKAEKIANETAALAKTHIVSTLGDCHRIWEQMRRLRPYNPAQNTKRGFDTSISNKTAIGTLKRNYTTRNDADLKPQGITFTYGGEGKTWVWVEPKKDSQKPIASNWQPPFDPTVHTPTTGGTAAVVDNSDIAGRILAAAQKCGDYQRQKGFIYNQDCHAIVKADPSTGFSYVPCCNGTDCSGSVWWALSEAGLVKNPTAGAPSTVGYRTDFSNLLIDGVSCVEVPEANIQAGDIILFDRNKPTNNHVAIYHSLGKLYDYGSKRVVGGPQPANRSLNSFGGVVSKKVWRIVSSSGGLTPTAASPTSTPPQPTPSTTSSTQQPSQQSGTPGGTSTPAQQSSN